tara:strand:+ start:6892 stop:7560 length:669 start_codon:yes stop_codon:yes gene_type:complete
MINFPEIQLKSEKNLVIIFSLSMIFFFFNFYDVKILVSFLLIIILLTNYEKLKESIHENIIRKDKKVSLNYNIKIEKNLLKLKKYKKKNPPTYNNAMYYWTYFMRTLDTLENDELFNYNQYFDKAFHYLQRSINAFQELGVNSYDRKYIDGLKYNDFTNSKELMKISKISKELYDEGYSLLYNLSLRLNKKWKKDPNVFNKEINIDHPLPFDSTLKKYDFYY